MTHYWAERATVIPIIMISEYVFWMCPQLLHDGLPASGLWICSRADVSRVRGNLLRTPQLFSTGTDPDTYRYIASWGVAILAFVSEWQTHFYCAYMQTPALLLHVLHIQVFGIIFTICQGKIIDSFGTLAGNIFLCVFLLIGTIITGKTFRRCDVWSHNKLLILSHTYRDARESCLSAALSVLFI